MANNRLDTGDVFRVLVLAPLPLITKAFQSRHPGAVALVVEESCRTRFDLVQELRLCFACRVDDLVACRCKSAPDHPEHKTAKERVDEKLYVLGYNNRRVRICKHGADDGVRPAHFFCLVVFATICLEHLVVTIILVETSRKARSRAANILVSVGALPLAHTIMGKAEA